MTWEWTHSVMADADRESVWAWYSNVENWARIEGSAVESITLDGPFGAGTHISTKMPGQDSRQSTLIEVEPPRRSVVQMDLNEAVLRFAWNFEELPGGRTRLTQHVLLEGPNAEAYVPFMQEQLAPNIGKGMEKMAAEIGRQASPECGASQAGGPRLP